MAKTNYISLMQNWRSANKKPDTMPGSTVPTFKCKQCRKSRLIKGRKMVLPNYPRGGYICHECAAKKA